MLKNSSQIINKTPTIQNYNNFEIKANEISITDQKQDTMRNMQG